MSVGGGTSVRGAAYISVGGLTLVLTWLMAGRGGAYMGGGEQKVSSSLKPVERQGYFAPFLKAAT